MKALRWTYYSSMTMFLVAGMYTGLRIFYIIFLTQTLTVIAMIFINLWTFYSFTYKQVLSQKVCTKGDVADLHLEISNEGPIPLSLVEVHVDVVSMSENINLTFSLAPYSSQILHIPVAAPYRGRYNVGMTRLKITDIFGLVTLSFDMRRLFFYRLTELIILPKASMPNSISQNVVDTKHFSVAYLRQAEHGDSIAGMRLYHDGDMIRRINWKKSAQHGKLFVKQYECPEREKMMIFVDAGFHGLTGEASLIYADTVCECAASIALHSLSKNWSVSVINSADEASFMRCDSLSDFDLLRRYLANIRFKSSADFNAFVMRSHAQTDSALSLFILTRELTPSLAGILNHTFLVHIPVTVILVGGRVSGGNVHTIFVEPGSDTAESLAGL